MFIYGLTKGFKIETGKFNIHTEFTMNYVQRKREGKVYYIDSTFFFKTVACRNFRARTMKFCAKNGVFSNVPAFIIISREAPALYN